MKMIDATSGCTVINESTMAQQEWNSSYASASGEDTPMVIQHPSCTSVKKVNMVHIVQIMLYQTKQHTKRLSTCNILNKIKCDHFHHCDHYKKLTVLVLQVENVNLFRHTMHY